MSYSQEYIFERLLRGVKNHETCKIQRSRDSGRYDCGSRIRSGLRAELAAAVTTTKPTRGADQAVNRLDAAELPVVRESPFGLRLDGVDQESSNISVIMGVGRYLLIGHHAFAGVLRHQRGG